MCFNVAIGPVLIIRMLRQKINATFVRNSDQASIFFNFLHVKILLDFHMLSCVLDEIFEIVLLTFYHDDVLSIRK